MTMPSLWSVLHAPTVELLGWTLLHFVWQGTLVAAVLAGALSLLRDHSPRVRYVVSCTALLGLLALPIGTGVVLHESVLPPAPSPSTVVVENGAEVADASRRSVAEPAVVTASSWRVQAVAWVRPALPWGVLAWGLGVIVFALRLGGGAWRVRRLRRTSTAVPTKWQDRLRGLANQMGVGPSVQLRQSDRVEGPVLAGWWKPVILLPVGVLSGLPPAQVEALLLHELAHVRRHDVLVSRLQAVVETLLFFHPATWWTSRQVRQAREACCDDLVIQAGSGRKTYAQALTALAERALDGPASTWAPASTDGSLLHRIRRLVAPPEAPSTAGRRLSIVAAALLMGLVPAGLAACASQQSTTTPETPSAPGTQAVEAGDAEEAPEAPSAPEAPTKDAEQRIVVVGPDSTARRVFVDPEGPGAVDGLDEEMYVVRTGADTIEVPAPDLLLPPFSPDSLERALWQRIDPDSLERVIRNRINPDSIERAVRRRFDPDSLERHVHRMRRRADSLAQRFAQQFSDDWAEHEWGRDFPVPHDPDDFNPDEFDRGDFGPGLDVDSLIHRHEQRADSLRRHFEQMRERMEREVPERLREEARRLRERAKQLEERAKEAEEQRLPPDDPQGSESESEG